MRCFRLFHATAEGLCPRPCINYTMSLLRVCAAMRERGVQVLLLLGASD